MENFNKNPQKREALRSYLNANRDYLNLSRISLQITGTNKMLLPYFLDSHYKGKPSGLGAFEAKTFEFFEDTLKIKFYDENL